MPSTLYNPDGSRTGVRINARSRRTKHMGEPTSGLFTQPTKSEQIAISESTPMPSTLYNPDGSRTGVRINARSRRTKHMGGTYQWTVYTADKKRANSNQ